MDLLENFNVVANSHYKANQLGVFVVCACVCVYLGMHACRLQMSGRSCKKACVWICAGYSIMRHRTIEKIVAEIALYIEYYVQSTIQVYSPTLATW